MKRTVLILTILIAAIAITVGADTDWRSRVGLEKKLWNSGLVDAFGRVRISDPHAIFDSKLLHNKDTLFWDEAITNGSGNATSTHDTTLAAVDMYAEASDTIIRQSRTHWAYEAGHGQLILASGVLDTAGGGTGVVARIGSFTAVNGLFFELSTDTMRVVIRRDAVDTKFDQEDWNIDNMLGGGGKTNPSGFTLDPSMAQVYSISYGWLGVSSAWFGYIVDGRWVSVHRFDHANTQRWTYTSTPNLPVRYEIAVAAGGADAKMRHICSSVLTEGGGEEGGVVMADYTFPTPVAASVADTIYAVMAIKLRDDHLDANVSLEEVSILMESATSGAWMVLVNPKVWGTFAFTDISLAAVAVAKGATANTITSGSWDIMAAVGFVASSVQSKGDIKHGLASELRLGSTIAGVPDTLVLAVQSISNTAVVQGSMTWREAH